MSGGTLDPKLLVLLVETTDGLAEAFASALGERWALRRATPNRPVEELARLEGLSAVLLGNAGGGDLPRWRRALENAGSGARLLALADDANDSRIEGWLAAGADDCAFRAHPKLLLTTLRRLKRDDQERAQAEERLRAPTAELMLLARSTHFRGDDLDAAIREVTQAGVRGLAVDRCGVWLFDEAQSVLRLLDRYDAGTQRHADGEQLPSQAYRPTMAGLLGQRLVAVSDARTDRRFKDFVGADTCSAIIVALAQRGEMVGVLLLEHRGSPRRWSAGEETHAVALADVTALALESAEHHRLELALSQSERRFQDLFLHTSDGTVLYRVAPDGTISCEDFNPAAEASTGLKRDDLIGRQIREVLEPKSAAKLEERYGQAIATRSAIVYEHDLELPTGTRWFNTAVVPLLDETGRVHRLAAIGRDVTQQREGAARERRLEQQVADAQKNEALARFATHVAHDVNNLLTVIIAHAQRVQPLSGRIGETGKAILDATTRGRELTQQILTFGRQRPPDRKPLELGPLVCTTLRLLEATAPGVSMSIDVPAHPFRVLGDEGQLHQVLTNLCTNALNALPNGQGKLTVALRAVTVDEPSARRHPSLKPGPWVRLSVSDTGSGMDEATVRRIFEPFFSARPDGSGTGLGLAVVQSIVEGHDGTVVVDSAPGHGSTFHVYLPSQVSDEAQPGLGQHVMLVDDHPGMARVSAKLLETLGYHTSVFDDPRDALAAFRARPADFDVVMTDLSMPQMSGEEFTRSLRELAPEVPVIVSSGMASEADREELHRQGFAGVLLKPWRLEEAVATLKRVLPASPA